MGLRTFNSIKEIEHSCNPGNSLGYSGGIKKFRAHTISNG